MVTERYKENIKEEWSFRDWCSERERTDKHAEEITQFGLFVW